MFYLFEGCSIGFMGGGGTLVQNIPDILLTLPPSPSPSLSPRTYLEAHQPPFPFTLLIPTLNPPTLPSHIFHPQSHSHSHSHKASHTLQPPSLLSSKQDLICNPYVQRLELSKKSKEMSALPRLFIIGEVVR